MLTNGDFRETNEKALSYYTEGWGLDFEVQEGNIQLGFQAFQHNMKFINIQFYNCIQLKA